MIDWTEYRKSENGMAVNHEFALAGKSKNDRQGGRAILRSHLSLKKSSGVEL